jgi:hypothetical protein
VGVRTPLLLLFVVPAQDKLGSGFSIISMAKAQEKELIFILA